MSSTTPEERPEEQVLGVGKKGQNQVQSHQRWLLRLTVLKKSLEEDAEPGDGDGPGDQADNRKQHSKQGERRVGLRRWAQQVGGQAPGVEILPPPLAD